MTLFEIAALLLAVFSLAGLWLTRRHLSDVETRLERIQTTLYSTRDDLRTGREEVDARLSSLHLALNQATGVRSFEPWVRLADLYAAEPRAQEVLAAFHIGGCDHCAVDENESLGQAVTHSGADLDRVLAALNAIPGQERPLDLRAPNVRLELEAPIRRRGS